MALSVDYIFQYALELVNKNQAGGLEDTRFCSLWNGEQSSYHGDLCGRFQRINNGKEGIQTGLIENETIIQKLSPFIKNYSIKEQTHIRKQVQEISKLLNEMLPSQDISVTIGGTIHAIHVQSDTDNVHIQHQISDLIHASLKPIE